MSDDWKAFWQIKEKWSKGALRVSSNSLTRKEAFAVTLGDYEGLVPLVFRRAQGHRAVDLIGSEFAILHLISQAVAEAFATCNLTGYHNYPAIIEGEGASILTDQSYFAIGITGRAGPIQWSQANVVPAVIGGHVQKDSRDYLGLPFDIESWDGSDIFTTRGNAFMLATSRVVDAISTHSLTNFECVSLADFRMPCD